MEIKENPDWGKYASDAMIYGVGATATIVAEDYATGAIALSMSDTLSETPAVKWVFPISKFALAMGIFYAVRKAEGTSKKIGHAIGIGTAANAFIDIKDILMPEAL
jgi:hypothetical protein